MDGPTTQGILGRHIPVSFADQKHLEVKTMEPVIEQLYSKKFLRRVEELGLNKARIYGLKTATIIHYPFISGKGFQNVKNVFKQSKEDDEILRLWGYESEFPHTSKHETAIAIAKAVNKQITYTSDRKNWGKAEYWASPIETWTKRKDDCDGHSVLITKLLRLLDFEPHEVFTAVGNVNHPTGRKEYHAYTVVLDESTGFFYPLEGSFYAKDSWKKFGKVPLHENPRYDPPDWITNDKKSYSRHNIMGFKFIR